MFNFTTTIRYSLRLLINLALGGKSPKQLKKISVEESISLPYLRKLIIPLEKSGIVKSLRGPGGGFILSRKPQEVPLWEIINILNHSKAIDCLDYSSNCQRYEDCAVKDLLEEVYSKVQSVFKNKTLATMIKRGPK
jgi:Rrf2 family protein